MKIIFLNNSYNNSFVIWKNNLQPINNLEYNTKCFDIPNDTVSFRQSSQIPLKAIESLKQQKSFLKSDYANLSRYNLKELDGLQKGIKVFEGLSFPQLAYLIDNFYNLVVYRGCNNKCIHCYADAQTPFHMKANNYINKIDFEDYQNILNGFEELNKRLGFNAFANSKQDTYALFHDADCSMIYLRDKNGKIYDYADLAKMLHDVTGKTIIFDTAGWNLTDKTTQKRMEDLVQKVSNDKKYNFLIFLVSMNPFHAIYNKSVELAVQGDIEKSKKFRDIYTDRMANVIFTLSPLIKEKNYINNMNMLNFLPRALKSETEANGYREIDLAYLMDEILVKLKKMYSDDLMSGGNKVIDYKEQIKDYLDFVNLWLGYGWGSISITNKTLADKLSGIQSIEHINTQEKSYNSALEGKLFEHGTVDVNGKFYMTNFVETYPTDIVLNYKNKGKATAPIKPNLRDEIITKEMI